MTWKRHLSFFGLAAVISALVVLATPLFLTRSSVMFSDPVAVTAADMAWWQSVTSDSLQSGEQLIRQEAGGIGWSVMFLHVETSTTSRQWIVRIRCGLPFECFEGRIRHVPYGPTVRESIAQLQFGSITRQVPTRILPWRFATNVLILAAAIFLLGLCIVRIRRAWRMCRGRCAACGYRLDILARCPECGQTR